jgi:hypothetical protein
VSGVQTTHEDGIQRLYATEETIMTTAVPRSTTTSTIARPPIVSREHWLIERKRLLEDQKELTKHYDRVNAERRRLPMVKVEKDGLRNKSLRRKLTYQCLAVNAGRQSGAPE